MKIRDDANVLDYLLHYKVDGREYVRPINFHLENDKINLSKGATEIVAFERKEEVKDE